MVDAQATLDTLRNIKNTVIGNPVAKKKLISDGTFSLVLEWIDTHQGISEPVFELIRIEAAHIIAAEAHGPPEALLGVLSAQAPQTLVKALKSPGVTEAPRLLIALTRALRAVVAAAADTVGPFRWHLPRLIAHPACFEARLVLEDIFAQDTMNVILPFLRHPEPEVRRNVALLLGRGVRIEAHRAKVVEWSDKAAVWSLVEMLDGDARSQSSALYALAELSRDNDLVARILSSPVPPFVILSSSIPFLQPAEHTHSTSPISPHVERGRTGEPLSLLAMTARSGVGGSSISRSISGSVRGEAFGGPRVLDIVRALLSARDGDVREAACLCLSNIVRQHPPLTHDPSHALIAWLNVVLEDFAPSLEFTTSTTETDKCRWKSSEVGGGEAARRALRASYILADFVNDRPDLQQIAVKGGTLQRAARALLALPPVPVRPGGWVPVGRWGPTPTTLGLGTRIGLGASVTGTPSEAGAGAGGEGGGNIPRPGSMTIGVTPGLVAIGGPSGISRTRRPSSTTPAVISPTAVSHTAHPISNSSTRTPVAPPPLSNWSSTPVSTGTAQRRLSFAELARRGSEPGSGAVETFASRARRPSATGANSVNTRSPFTASGGGVEHNSSTSEEAGRRTSSANPSEMMALDPALAAPVAIPAAGDEIMRTAEPITRTSESVDTIMNVADPPVLVSASAPVGPPRPTKHHVAVPSNTNGTTRRRRKPPSDPALGPYVSPLSSPPAGASDPGSLAPPAPTSPLRAALLVLLAALVMHSEDHRRILVEAGALGAVLGQTGSGGIQTGAKGTPEGVTGVLGALGSPDPEVRWSGTMVVRAVGRSTSVLRTGLYDSGIGRAIFELLMRGDSDRRVLVAVLMACCNMLNQYSPMREMFIRDGGMARLVELIDDTETAVKLNALWAIKNMLFKSTTSESRIVISVLGFSKLNRLLDESTGDILEQVLGIVRNVTTTDSEAEWLVSHVTALRLLSAIERTLSSESTATAALFSLAQLATVPTIRTQTLSRRRTLEFLSASLGHRDAQVRCAAAHCVGSLANAVPRRLREMRELGIDARLRVMRSTEEDSEARDHAKRALLAFEGRDA